MLPDVVELLSVGQSAIERWVPGERCFDCLAGQGATVAYVGTMMIEQER